MLQTYPQPDTNSTKTSYLRETSTKILDNFKLSSSSQRQFAQESHIPRTTLQHWAHRQLRLQQQTPAALFFETPDGLDVLHRITIAAQFVLTKLSGGSIPDFLRTNTMICLSTW